jgi:erythromycin esterase
MGGGASIPGKLGVAVLVVLPLMGLAGQSSGGDEETASATSTFESEAVPAKAAQGWLATNAIRLKTVAAGHGFADLQPLKAMIGPARIVALGEATHGTREFFQLKHRLLEFLP